MILIKIEFSEITPNSKKSTQFQGIPSKNCRSFFFFKTIKRFVRKRQLTPQKEDKKKKIKIKIKRRK